MPSGKAVTESDFRRVLQLLRKSHRNEIRRSQIAGITQLHRHTVTSIIEQAAVKWLEAIEEVERNDEMCDRGR